MNQINAIWLIFLLWLKVVAWLMNWIINFLKQKLSVQIHTFSRYLRVLPHFISFTPSNRIICVLQITHVHIFNVGPLSSANKACFSLWFPLQQAKCDSQQPSCRKRSCELAKYSACAEEEKKEETCEREEDKVLLHQWPTRTKPSSEPRNKPQQRNELSDNRITTSPQMSHLSLAQYLNQYERTSSLSPSSSCFCTSDLYQHLNPLLNSWHQKVVLEVASYILFETRCKYDTPPKLSTSTQFISNHQLLNDTGSWTKT